MYCRNHGNLSLWWLCLFAFQFLAWCSVDRLQSRTKALIDNLLLYRCTGYYNSLIPNRLLRMQVASRIETKKVPTKNELKNYSGSTEFPCEQLFSLFFITQTSLLLKKIIGMHLKFRCVSGHPFHRVGNKQRRNRYQTLHLNVGSEALEPHSWAASV